MTKAILIWGYEEGKEYQLLIPESNQDYKEIRNQAEKCTKANTHIEVDHELYDIIADYEVLTEDVVEIANKYNLSTEVIIVE